MHRDGSSAGKPSSGTGTRPRTLSASFLPRRATAWAPAAGSRTSRDTRSIELTKPPRSVSNTGQSDAVHVSADRAGIRTDGPGNGRASVSRPDRARAPHRPTRPAPDGEFITIRKEEQHRGDDVLRDRDRARPPPPAIDRRRRSPSRSRFPCTDSDLRLNLCGGLGGLFDCWISGSWWSGGSFGRPGPGVWDLVGWLVCRWSGAKSAKSSSNAGGAQCERAGVVVPRAAGGRRCVLGRGGVGCRRPRPARSTGRLVRGCGLRGWSSRGCS